VTNASAQAVADRIVTARNRLVEFVGPDEEGRFEPVYKFHPGQWKAWHSKKRYTCIFAGQQSGKSSFLPWWLYREVYDPIIGKGGGDYLAITANFPLFDTAFLPNILEVFVDILGYGRYWPGSKIVELMDPTTGQFWAKNAKDRMWGRILLMSAAAGKIVSVTAKAAIVDEAGLPEYTATIWSDIKARLSVHQGRAAIGTTVYDLGWMKTALYDPWSACRRIGQEHPMIDVVQFDSTENPAFPAEEFEEHRRTLPKWQFEMRFRGLFSRPAGAIYDCFDRDVHVIEPFKIPDHWRRYGGLDFGGVHTAAVFLAEDPDTGTLYLYREYMAGNRKAADHTKHLLRGEKEPPRFFGGSQSEDQWRREFRAAGLTIGTPQKDLRDVEVGINRVYAFLKDAMLKIFNTCTVVIEDLVSYSRKLDDAGDPTEEIKDKSTYHAADACRYILGSMKKARWTPIGYPSSPYD
jgi:hypothetical protein